MSTAIKRAPSKNAPPKQNLLPSIIAAIVAVIVAIIILKIPALSSPWSQGYDPTGHWWLSTLIASLPVMVLLGAWLSVR